MGSLIGLTGNVLPVEAAVRRHALPPASGGVRGPDHHLGPQEGRLDRSDDWQKFLGVVQQCEVEVLHSTRGSGLELPLIDASLMHDQLILALVGFNMSSTLNGH